MSKYNKRPNFSFLTEKLSSVGKSRWKSHNINAIDLKQKLTIQVEKIKKTIEFQSYFPVKSYPADCLSCGHFRSRRNTTVTGTLGQGGLGHLQSNQSINSQITNSSSLHPAALGGTDTAPQWSSSHNVLSLQMKHFSGCLLRLWRSWTGAWTSWRPSRPTGLSPTWRPAR